MKNLKFKQNTFLQALNRKLKKWQKAPIFVKSEFYASLLRPYFMFTDSLLIIQMLKFKQKRDIKRPDFRKNDVYTSFTDVLRWSYGGLTILY